RTRNARRSRTGSSTSGSRPVGGSLSRKRKRVHAQPDGKKLRGSGTGTDSAVSSLCGMSASRAPAHPPSALGEEAKGAVIVCQNAILKGKPDGTVTTFAHPGEVKDRDDVLGKEPHSRFFHPPYLRGLDVTEEGVVYAAVTGRRCVVKVTAGGKVETVLKSEPP